MRHTLTIILLFSVQSLFAQYGVTKDKIEGVAGMKFGQAKSECISTINGKKEIQNDGIETSDMYIVKYVTVSGVLFNECVLNFYDGKLIGCILRAMYDKRSEAIDISNKLSESLSLKYGKYDGISNTDAAWRDDDYKAILLSVEKDSGSFVCKLGYTDMVASDRKKKSQKSEL